MGRSRRAFLTRLALSKGFRVLDAYRYAVVDELVTRGTTLRRAPARDALRGSPARGFCLGRLRGHLPGGPSLEASLAGGALRRPGVALTVQCRLCMYCLAVAPRGPCCVV